MRKEQIQEFKDKVFAIADAPNKREADRLRGLAHFASSDVAADVGPYLANKLREAIDFAYDAAGQVPDSAHWRQVMMQSWGVFESRARASEATP